MRRKAARKRTPATNGDNRKQSSRHSPLSELDQLGCRTKARIDTSATRDETGAMEIHELVVEMKLLERRLTLYEEKYGILSEDFHVALVTGKLARYDGFDETRADFSRWKGIYETWLRRKESYVRQLKERRPEESLRFQPAY